MDEIRPLHPVFTSNVQVAQKALNTYSHKDLGIVPKYWITEMGQVFNVDHCGRGIVVEVKPFKIPTDIETVYVTLERDDGEWFPYKLADIVAGCYLGPPPSNIESPVVLHRDENGNNNFFGNLYWADSKNKNVIEKLKKYSNDGIRSRACAMYTEDGMERIKSFSSITAAARELGVSSSVITLACKFNKNKGLGKVNDYRFKFLEKVGC